MNVSDYLGGKLSCVMQKQVLRTLSLLYKKKSWLAPDQSSILLTSLKTTEVNSKEGLAGLMPAKPSKGIWQWQRLVYLLIGVFSAVSLQFIKCFECSITAVTWEGFVLRVPDAVCLQLSFSFKCALTHAAGPGSLTRVTLQVDLWREWKKNTSSNWRELWWPKSELSK